MIRVHSRPSLGQAECSQLRNVNIKGLFIQKPQQLVGVARQWPALKITQGVKTAVHKQTHDVTVGCPWSVHFC